MHRHPRSSQDGVVILEVLVSLLLFAFGVLGLVGLQAAMTRNQTEAKSRADAAYLANELVGTIWSDAVNVASYASNDGCAARPRCADWTNKVAATLPNGSVTLVQTPSGTAGDITITINWTLPSGATHSYSTQTTVH